MSGQLTEQLFQLICSLSPSEKRSFKLYSARNGGKNALKFVQLFDVLSRQDSYDESLVLTKIKGIKKEQLTNVKSHLYKELLASLRLYHKQQHEVILIREMLDYASILYAKGLHLQSLQMLQKAKVKAQNHKEGLLQLEINHFERLIESRYITRSLKARAKELIGESRALTKAIQNTDAYSNFALALYSRFIRKGHIKNSIEYEQFVRYFQRHLPQDDENNIPYFAQIYRCQCFVWFAYITQDFLLCYKHALRWIRLIEEKKGMMDYVPELYLKGLHNVLATLYYTGHTQRFRYYFELMEQFCENRISSKEENLELYSFIYLENNRINLHIMEGKFTEACALIPDILLRLEANSYRLDSHRKMIFYYKFACLHIGNGSPKDAIRFLRPIIENQQKSLRDDIQCFARILNLVAHFELGNDDLLEYQLKSVYRYLLKMNELGPVQKEILSFLRKVVYLHKTEVINAFTSLKNKLEQYENLPYEKRPFLYLDIISWLESHIEKTNVQDIIRRKYLERDKKLHS